MRIYNANMLPKNIIQKSKSKRKKNGVFGAQTSNLPTEIKFSLQGENKYLRCQNLKKEKRKEIFT